MGLSKGVVARSYVIQDSIGRLIDIGDVLLNLTVYAAELQAIQLGMCFAVRKTWETCLG